MYQANLIQQSEEGNSECIYIYDITLVTTTSCQSKDVKYCTILRNQIFSNKENM